MGRELKSGGRSLSNLGLGRFNNHVLHLHVISKPTGNTKRTGKTTTTNATASNGRRRNRTSASTTTAATATNTASSSLGRRSRPNRSTTNRIKDDSVIEILSDSDGEQEIIAVDGPQIPAGGGGSKRRRMR